MNVATWIDSDQQIEPAPMVIILDTWPLRSTRAATQAQTRIAAQAVPVVLLVEHPHPVPVANLHGTIATLPLIFTPHDLITVVQQSAGLSSCDSQYIHSRSA